MKIKNKLGIGIVLTFFLFVSLVAADSQWNSIYYYTDYEKPAYTQYLPDDIVEVQRMYLWKDLFENLYSAKVQIKDLDVNMYETTEAREWTSPRLAIANPDNDLERYELRFYPETDKLQVNYVDRTGRTGDWKVDKEFTVSEILSSVDCTINEQEWYYAVMTHNGDDWKAVVMSGDYPTCIVRWSDDRINSEEFVVGVQSAGKYIVSNFQRVVTI